MKRKTAAICGLIALGQSAVAQGDRPAWQDGAAGQLIGRTDTVIVSWPNDVLTVSMGKTDENFDPAEFARDVVCGALLEAGKPRETSVDIDVYSLSFDGVAMHEELIATDTCN